MKLDITDILQLYYKDTELTSTSDKNDIYSSIESIFDAASLNSWDITYCLNAEFDNDQISKIIIYAMNKTTYNIMLEDYYEYAIFDEDDALDFEKDEDYVEVVKMFDDMKCSCDLNILMSIGCQCRAKLI